MKKYLLWTYAGRRWERVTRVIPIVFINEGLRTYKYLNIPQFYTLLPYDFKYFSNLNISIPRLFSKRLLIK